MLVITLSAAILSLSYTFFLQELAEADQFEVYASEKFIGKYTLHEDRRLELHGKIGNSTLQVADGKVRFITSPCKSKYCIHQGWLTATHGFNACLPNGISIHLAGKSHYDAINF